MPDFCQQEQITVKLPTNAAQSQTTPKIARFNIRSYGSNNSITIMPNSVLTCSVAQGEIVCTKFVTYVYNFRKQSGFLRIHQNVCRTL